jgi:hypothetical protein
MLVNARRRSRLISIAFIPEILFCCGMNELQPQIDKDGKPYYTVSQAAKIIGGITEHTLGLWMSAGLTDFDLDLDVKRQYEIRPEREPRLHTEIEKQNLIAEADVHALKEILHGRFTDPNPSLPESQSELGRRATEYQRRLYSPQHS